MLRGRGFRTRRLSEAADGALYVGSPETVAQKIASTARTPGLARLDLKYSNGTMAHELLMRSIELYGGEVAPRVRELLADYGVGFSSEPLRQIVARRP